MKLNGMVKWVCAGTAAFFCVFAFATFSHALDPKIRTWDGITSPVLKTQVQTAPDEQKDWAIQLPAGNYYVCLSLGDVEFSLPSQYIELQGTPIWPSGVTTATGEFASVEYEPVTGADEGGGVGLLTVTVGQAGGVTGINYISIHSSIPSDPPGGFPVKVNFEQLGTTTPSGYSKDYGLVYDAGVGYGWDQNLTSYTRERGVNDDKRLDTLIYHKGLTGDDATATWKLDVPNGLYYITLSCGDPSYGVGFGTNPIEHLVRVEGFTVIDHEPVASNEFVTLQNAPILVTDEELTVVIGDNPGQYTELDYIEVHKTAPGPLAAEDFPFHLNFQPSYEPYVRGYRIDGGAEYSEARTYGWDQTLTQRNKRDMLTNKLYDTLVRPDTGAQRNWKIDVASPGTYYLFFVCGDPLYGYPGQPIQHRVTAEGVTLIDDEYTASNEFYHAMNKAVNSSSTGETDQIDVSAGGIPSMATICEFMVIDDQPLASLSFPYRINFQHGQATLPAGSDDADTGGLIDLSTGYGWDQTAVGVIREGVPNSFGDERDTAVRALPGWQREWNLFVPNDVYDVTVRMGNNTYGSPNIGPMYCTAEGVTLVDGWNPPATSPPPADPADFFTTATQTVEVTDNWLTLTLSADSDGGASDLCYIEIDEN